MSRHVVTWVLVTLLASLRLASFAVATESAVGRYSLYPRVVARVLTLEPRGLATIASSDGAHYEVIRGAGWRVGDTITCEYAASERPSAQAWQTLQCWKTS